MKILYRIIVLYIMIIHAPALYLLPSLLFNTRLYDHMLYTIMAYQKNICATCTIKSPISINESYSSDFAGNFTKLLEHDTTTGMLTKNGKNNYLRLINALNIGKQNNFYSIYEALECPRIYVNPERSHDYSAAGINSLLPPLVNPPQLSTAWAAIDLLELYLQAVCRDINFDDYGTGENTDKIDTHNSLTQKATLIISNFPDYQGAHTIGNTIDPTVLFRGNSPGDIIGPYISQFLLMPYMLHSISGDADNVGKLIGLRNLPLNAVTQKQLHPIAQKREFGVSWDDFISLQNGLIPKQYAYTDYDNTAMRHISNGRDLASYVHFIDLFELYYNTVNILLAYEFPISTFPPFCTYEKTNIALNRLKINQMIIDVSFEIFKCTWAQKWRFFRRLRPEEMAGLVHRVKITGANPYNLHHSLFSLHNGIDPLQMVLDHNSMQASFSIDPMQLLSPALSQTCLLSQVYPEGSPTHPSYPAAHATTSGAYITILKALFDDTIPIIKNYHPVKPNPADPTQLIPLDNAKEMMMTVGSELDKLASNIAFGRNFAGIHYRADSDGGILFGEQIAIYYLQNQALLYKKDGFPGFELTKRNGQRIRITAQRIEVINTPI